MKTHHTGEPQHVSGALLTKKITIAANAKAFKELISGIYSDKAYAIARELIQNVTDAHIAAGTPERQFELHVPTKFESYFSIRDFGISMSPETVEVIFTQLFTSTKDNPDSEFSNTQTGKFGLGSKSPFSYTDSFQVTTYLDGIQRVYDCYLSLGEPVVSLFLEEPTTEENGVLVSFPVDSKDIPDFERAILKAVIPLDLDPIFIGKQLDITRPEPILSFPGCEIYAGSGNTIVRMGTVHYPFNVDAVINAPKWLHSYQRANMRIDIPIGDAEVTTSREALSYDERTSENIIKHFEKAKTALIDHCLKEIESKKTHADKCAAISSTISRMPSFVSGLVWRDLKRCKGRELSRKIYAQRGKTTDLASQDDSRVLKGLAIYPMNSDSAYFPTSFTKYKKRNPQTFIYDPSKKLVFITEDLDQKNRYSSSRINNFLIGKSPNKYELMWIRYHSSQTNAQFALKRLYVMLGRPTNFEHVNLLEVTGKEIIAKETRLRKKPIRYDLKLVRGTEFVPYSLAEGEVLDGYFVPIKSNMICYDYCTLSALNLKNTLDSLISLDLLPSKPLFAVPRNKSNILATQPRLISLLPALLDAALKVDVTDYLISTELKKIDYVRPMRLKWSKISYLHDHYVNALEVNNKNLLELFKSVTKTKIHELINLYDNYDKQCNYNEASSVQRVLYFVKTMKGADYYSESEEIAESLCKDLSEVLEKRISEAFEMYPALKLLSNNFIPKDELYPFFQSCLHTEYALGNRVKFIDSDCSIN